MITSEQDEFLTRLAKILVDSTTEAKSTKTEQDSYWLRMFAASAIQSGKSAWEAATIASNTLRVIKDLEN